MENEQEKPNFPCGEDVPGEDADCLGLRILAKEMASRGQCQVGGKAIFLEDARGAQAKTSGRKLAQVECDLGMAGSVIIEDDFIVASVHAPLVSRSTSRRTA